MRITIETDDQSPSVKTVEVPAVAQASAGAAPSGMLLKQHGVGQEGERMVLNAGSAPSLASLTSRSGDLRQAAVPQHHDVTAINAGTAPEALKQAVRSENQAPVAEAKNKSAPKGK